MLDKVEININACRHPVHDTTDSGPMTLAEGRERENAPKSISHKQLFILNSEFFYKGTLFASILIPISGYFIGITTFRYCGIGINQVTLPPENKITNKKD